MKAASTREGFFWCSRCKAVVAMSEQQVESALSMPAGALVKLKCPGCHHYEVQWKVATAERPRKNDGRMIKPLPPAVDPVKAKELFAQVRAELAHE